MVSPQQIRAKAFAILIRVGGNLLRHGRFVGS